MPSVVLTEPELDALAGLPHPCIALYIALRRKMDGATGIVGAPHLCSWQALKEAVYVEPAPGRGGYAPSRWALLRLAQWLVKAGLVEMRSNARQHQLIVRMKKAPVFSLVQKKAARNPHLKPHSDSHRGHPQEPARHPPPQPAPHLGSIANVAAALGGNLSTSRAPAYPQTYSHAEKTALLQVIDENQLDAGTAQLLIDELIHAESKTLVRNRAGFFVELVKQLKRGTFFGEGAKQTRSNGRPLSPEESNVAT